MNLKYYRETDRSNEIIIGPKEIHGQLKTYQRGCRCQECRARNAKQSKKKQDQNRAALRKHLDEKIAAQFGVQ